MGKYEIQSYMKEYRNKISNMTDEQFKKEWSDVTSKLKEKMTINGKNKSKVRIVSSGAKQWM